MSNPIRSKHFITDHAVERFAERVLKQDITKPRAERETQIIHKKYARDSSSTP